jgi:hypothetical protein
MGPLVTVLVNSEQKKLKKTNRKNVKRMAESTLPVKIIRYIFVKENSRAGYFILTLFLM